MLFSLRIVCLYLKEKVLIAKIESKKHSDISRNVLLDHAFHPHMQINSQTRPDSKLTFTITDDH